MASPFGIEPLDQTLPSAPAIAAPTTGNTDPETTLLTILRQIGALQGQPLVPENNPLLQMAAGLSGFAAGTQGRPNPVLAQLKADRAAQLQGLLGTAQIAGTIDSMQQRRQQTELDRQKFLLSQTKDAREVTQKKIDNFTSIGKAGMSSSDPFFRSLGGRMTAEALKLSGMELPPDMLAGLTAMPFDADKVKDALRMKAMGVPDATIVRSKGFSPETWQGIVATSSTDDARKILGLPTQAEEMTAALDVQTKTLTNIQKQVEIATPKFAKDLWTYAAANGVNPMTATPADWQKAAKDFIAQDMGKAMAAAGAQPVSGQLLDSYVAISGSLDSLETIDTLLKDPKAMTDLSSYMGTINGMAGWNEWLGRKAPGFVGQIPKSVLVLAFAEDQGKNILIKARSGAAVAAHEMARLENEWPNRERDAFREYKVKHEWAKKAAIVLKRRLEVLGGPGGRKALEAGGPAAYSQYAADVIMQNPLPPPIATGTTPKLPPGFSVPGGR